MTTAERITACIAKHPDWPDKRIANALVGAHIPDIEAVRAGNPLPGPQTSPSGTGLIDLAQVRRHYDVFSKILQEIKNIPAGKLLAESELCQRVVGSDRNRFRKACENNLDALKVYRVKLKIEEGTEGKYFWGSQADIIVAARMRDL
jgi:hypothetical protein